MSHFAFCVLGSGSSGNCSLLRVSAGRWIMIDAGFSMRQTKERMRTHNISLDQITDLLLTHLDRDHFNPAWCRTLCNRGVRVHVHESHMNRAQSAGLDRSILVPFTDGLHIEQLHVETIHMAHDSLGTVGFVFTYGDCNTRVGFATDLGHVPEVLLQTYTSLDVLAIESNYDPTMQRMSGRPEFLQERIMGGQGHLSNEETLEAVRRIDNQSTLKHLVLLHLSRQCNAQSIIRTLYQDRLAHLHERITITHQDRCSRLLTLEKQGSFTPSPLF
ncbi:MAG: MBL fold metallo-hydrolase [Phycisphaerales bacterium]|jgi:phosphoribosyl 1,2-cyclic phosphodiesterase|nr:MBL fold metallo-hydrolase [Phycisphaerales bacterium]